MYIKILHTDSSSWWLKHFTDLRYGIKSSAMIVQSVGLDSKNGVTDIEILYDETNNGKHIEKPGKYRICPDLININKSKLSGSWDPLNFVIGKDIFGNEKCIVFNTLGFILNDQGKTLEKFPETWE